MFPKPNRAKLEEALPPGTLSDTQCSAVWSFLLRCSDPSEVAHTFRAYRDSPHCSVPREKLRAMRDVLIAGMREVNRASSNPRKEKRKGTHYPDYFEMWHAPERNSA